MCVRSYLVVSVESEILKELNTCVEMNQSAKVATLPDTERKTVPTDPTCAQSATELAMMGGLVLQMRSRSRDVKYATPECILKIPAHIIKKQSVICAEKRTTQNESVLMCKTFAAKYAKNRITVLEIALNKKSLADVEPAKRQATVQQTVLRKRTKTRTSVTSVGLFIIMLLVVQSTPDVTSVEAEITKPVHRQCNIVKPAAAENTRSVPQDQEGPMECAGTVDQQTTGRNSVRMSSVASVNRRDISQGTVDARHADHSFTLKINVQINAKSAIVSIRAPTVQGREPA